MVYLVNCIMVLKSAQNTNGVLDWLSTSSLHQCKILTTVMIQPAERQVSCKINGIFSDRGMDHIQSFGSTMHDAWNILSSEIKPECDMLEEDSQTIFLMQIISLRILWACVWISVCISVWSFGYKETSIIPHAIGRNLWGKAPQFSPSMICELFPAHGTWSLSTRHLSKSFWQTEMNFSQQANPRRSFSSTELKFLQHNNPTKLRV